VTCIKERLKIYSATAALGSVLLICLWQQSSVTHNALGAAPSASTEEHSYMIVRFTCGLTCKSCKENCDSAQPIKNLGESLTRDLIAALRAQMNYEDDSKIGSLDIAYDATDARCNNKSCDRISIDLGSQELLIFCKSKEQHFGAFSETGGRCPYPLSKKRACFDLMISNFVQELEEHNHDIHILGIRGRH